MEVNADKVNLFVYGSLRDSVIFRSVCGLGFTRRAKRVDDQTLFAEPAFLSGYRRVSPDGVYYYAVPAPASRIEGLVIHDVPLQAIEQIDRYEGAYYRRDTITVHTASGPVKAEAYLVSTESMTRHFGDRFHVNLIHELWLRKRIGRFISRLVKRGQRPDLAALERVAIRQLLGTTERDLVIAHYGTNSISDYYVQRQLDRPIPSIAHVKADPQAQPFVNNYLRLVLKQVMLNELDDRIQTRFRFEIEQMSGSARFYKRTLSLLAALQIMNTHDQQVDDMVQQGLDLVPLDSADLIDYVKYAVRAGRRLFESRVVKHMLDWIASNRQGGLTPMGFEMELSNLGYKTVCPDVAAMVGIDPVYDCFRYFFDFQLDVLAWRLGAYIDDHSGSFERVRRCGFLELAPGRLTITGALSRPSTADPWVLNQLIQQLVQFFEVKPHSLHISLQLRRRQVGQQKVLPVGFAMCLLALGGGLEQRPGGGHWLTRLARREIVQSVPEEELVFARTSKRKWHYGLEEGAKVRTSTYVQQYKFIRLDGTANYEPLILCLKGLQIAYNPGDYLTAAQLRADAALRKDYQDLCQWAESPTPIPPDVIGSFLDTVYRGLFSERHRRPAHNLHYLDWTMDSLADQLYGFNKLVSGQNA